MKKLYVGNLPYSADESGLKEYFASAGTVESVKIINDRETGRSKGFGFVEMSTEEEAQEVINTFNGQELDGRSLKIAIAKPQEKRPPRNNYNDRF